VAGIFFTPGGKKIISLELDGSITEWDTVKGSALRNTKGSELNTVSGSCFSRNGKYLVCFYGGSKIIKLWDLGLMSEIDRLEEEQDVIALDFHPDSRTVAAALYGGNIRIRDVATRRIKISFRAKETASAIAFSSDGSMLAAGLGNGTISFWDVSSGDLKSEIRAHQSKVTAVSFNPSFSTLVSAGLDGIVKLWDLNSGKEIKSFKSHTYGVTALAFAPGGRVFASGSHDDTVHLYSEIPVRKTFIKKEEKQIAAAVSAARIVRSAGVLDDSEPGYCLECGEKLGFFARLFGRKYCREHKKC